LMNQELVWQNQPDSCRAPARGPACGALLEGAEELAIEVREPT
jgi:hypothetical protein